MSAVPISGASWVEAYGYSGCVELSNDHVRVVLDPNVGGRVLEYSIDGRNVLWINESLNGVTYQSGGERFQVCAGRSDVGVNLPRRDDLWMGSWEAKITGPFAAQMTSRVCSNTQLQLIRTYELNPDSSLLCYTQRIVNRGSEPIRVSHWARTFATGDGIAIAPLHPQSRLPQGYAIAEVGESAIYVHPPSHPSIAKVGDRLVIRATPPMPKFYFDSEEGWLAFLSPVDLALIKTYRIDPLALYGDSLASTASIWYPGKGMVEVEPMGPVALLKPGEATAFQEFWSLCNYPFPGEGSVDLALVDAKVAETQVEMHAFLNEE